MSISGTDPDAKKINWNLSLSISNTLQLLSFKKFTSFPIFNFLHVSFIILDSNLISLMFLKSGKSMQCICFFD